MRYLLMPACALAWASLAAPVSSQTVLPSDNESSVMQGFPPPSDQIVNRANQIQQRNLRWSLSHMRMLMPTDVIRRGQGPISGFPVGKPLAPPAFKDQGGIFIDFGTWMRRTHADALIVVHDGSIVFEGYASGVDPATPHTIQSITKSFIGIAAEMLIADGKIDRNAKVSRYVPELASSAWADATIQQALDMTAAVRYNEDLKDPNSDVHRTYAFASGNFAPPPDYRGPGNIYEMLERLPREGEHGAGFTYKTVHPEVIAWVVSRVTGQKLPRFLGERIWSRIGAEEDAYVTVDPAGTAMMGGGMSVTARDLARFGEMLRQEGHYNGQQIVPAAAVREVFKGGDVEKFRADPLRRSMVDFSYHDFWWKPPAPGRIQGLGGFGQHLYINQTTGTVIVKFSSAAIGPAYDEAKLLDPLGFAAIVEMLGSAKGHCQKKCTGR